jgi:glycosyltransferase involved in cell wall biosynthesis
LIHLCNGFRPNLDAIVAAGLLRVPCVCHVKGFAKHNWLDRFFARSVDLGICMTEAVRQDCERQRITAKRMTVIYDGLDVEGFCPTREPLAIRRELGIPVEVPLVGIIGNIQTWKGQAVVVEAIREVKSAIPQIRCLIVGGIHRNGKEYAEQIRRFIEITGLHDNIIFTGFREDVADLIGALDLLIHASISAEPFGRVILEGMALGKAVIATNMGGVPEFVEDGVTGRLVPPGDSKALARAMIELLGDAAQRHSLGNHGRVAVHRRFTVEQHVREICQAYTSLGFHSCALGQPPGEQLSQLRLPNANP